MIFLKSGTRFHAECDYILFCLQRLNKYTKSVFSAILAPEPTKIRNNVLLRLLKQLNRLDKQII